ncbi:MAG: hypothetical protein H5U40_17240, partial [Polyangiaceae bacterium]|nr:hypothetical protein [Polyangiaceae bacterium]
PGTVRATIEPAPSALVSSIRLRCDGIETTGAPPSVEVSIVPTDAVSCRSEALSARGAALLATEREVSLGREASGRRAVPWIIGASVAGAAIVAIVVVAAVGGDEDNARFGGTTVVGW